MSKFNTTHVWEINEHRLVVADTIEEAVAIYCAEYGLLSVDKVEKIKVSGYNGSDLALVKKE